MKDAVKNNCYSFVAAFGSMVCPVNFKQLDAVGNNEQDVFMKNMKMTYKRHGLVRLQWHCHRVWYSQCACSIASALLYHVL